MTIEECSFRDCHVGISACDQGSCASIVGQLQVLCRSGGQRFEEATSRKADLHGLAGLWRPCGADAIRLRASFQLYIGPNGPLRAATVRGKGLGGHGALGG